MNNIDWGKLLTSKTFWVNVLALIIFVVQGLTGETWINPAIQAAILAVLNLILRYLTNDAVTKEPETK
ncbi:MAG: hypothetical protein WC639_04790 [Patescibacteria group bacterium]|jgi:uncharacterized membrane protein